VRFVVIALAVGFPIAMLLSWLYEFTPAGIVRTEDVDPVQARSLQRATGRILDFIIIGVLLLVIAMLIVGRRPFYRQTGESISQKSIAVLPFQNLSANQENIFFADGVQDQILTDLAKVADLKVISRTSVMQYRNTAARNLRTIAQQLGVAHVLEGTVQREGGKVRVTAELINAETDAHEWAENYDRPLDDVFAIQSEIARAIATQLQANLSPREEAAIEKLPTTNLTAYDLYLHAQGLNADTTGNIPAREKLPQAARLLDEAVARDPHFLLAWCLLIRVHGALYSEGYDHTSARLDLANAAVQAALRLEPDAGETHLALAVYYYHVSDYALTRSELAIARRTLPNNAEVFEYTGYVERRKGHWKEATRELERAVDLDPRNFLTLQQLAVTYSEQRRYADQARTLDRALMIVPGDPLTRITRAGCNRLAGRYQALSDHAGRNNR
jgi:TolB-like protein/Flp pilus assembly protein TadD